MRLNFNKLIDYSENCKKAGNQINCADERSNLAVELLQQALKNHFELDDRQLIVSSRYSNEAILYVIYEIYGKLPKVITVATEKTKIVSFV